MWADGFNGLRHHLASRAGFAVVSPDAVRTQQAFAQSRGWEFPLYSGKGSTFIKDMGYLPKADEPMPGVSTFRRRGAKIYRIATAPFGPFDQFCATSSPCSTAAWATGPRNTATNRNNVESWKAGKRNESGS
jgi:predicted dithiol-disulfide oxidoreductase (DUF899 family)